jgi:hypothetical protein
MTTCVISQPRFFPGLHYLHRMMTADVFVILDSVQFNPRHEENRTKLRTPGGEEWLTVPMRRTSREQLIQDTYLDSNQTWQRKAMKTIQHLYGKAPHYEAHAPEINRILETPFETLMQLDHASWEPALRLLGVTCRFLRSSELPVSGKGPRLLLDICRHVGADTYLSGMFGREYLDTDEFAREGVSVLFHEYTYRPYPQRFEGFVPYMSYLDMLFNTGLEREVVLSSGRMTSFAEAPVQVGVSEETDR